MTIPVLLVGGFLGAGKTSFVNAMLRDPGGRRIAAIVNDFGAIDIDGELIGGAAEGVVSLRNGCICCSLQGDLMRTLATMIRRDPAPEAIVIETSGASDPAEIVRALLDPVIHVVAPLDAVVTLVDARHLADRPELRDDPLWRAQIEAADFCVPAKTDLVTAEEAARLRTDLARHKAPAFILDRDVLLGTPGLLWSGPTREAAARRAGPLAAPAADRFDSLSWRAEAPLALDAFQAAIQRLAPSLLRAKGFVVFAHAPERRLLFQLVGRRATLVPSPAAEPGEPSSRLVLIGERGTFDPRRAASLLDAASGGAEAVRSGRG